MIPNLLQTIMNSFIVKTMNKHIYLTTFFPIDKRNVRLEKRHRLTNAPMYTDNSQSYLGLSLHINDQYKDLYIYSRQRLTTSYYVTKISSLSLIPVHIIRLPISTQYTHSASSKMPIQCPQHACAINS